MTSNLQSRHYRYILTDPLGTARRDPQSTLRETVISNILFVAQFASNF